MAGHSQFKNIMHRKGKQDAVRSKLFSKLAREITVAAKMGMPDVNMNPRLRMAVLAARAENMPKDNIQRAINKAAGGEGDNYDEVRYEGYGPNGVAKNVEALLTNASSRPKRPMVLAMSSGRRSNWPRSACSAITLSARAASSSASNASMSCREVL